MLRDQYVGRLMTISHKSQICDIKSSHEYIIKSNIYQIDPPRERYMDRYVSVINDSLSDNGVVVL